MERENIDERSHSCKWYFDEALNFYNDIVDPSKDGKKTEKTGLLKRLMEAVGKHGVSHNKNDDFNPEVKPALYIDENAKILSGSVFPLFLYSEAPAEVQKTSDPRWVAMNFERKKFEICKTLNTIDSIVVGLCGNNVDSTSMGLDTHIVGRHTILKWLFTSSEQTRASKQEKDRAWEFYRQILTWWLKQTDVDYSPKFVSADTAPMDEQTRREYQEVIDQVKIKLKPEEEMRFFDRIRSSLAATIDQIHDAYQSLSGFRKYAIRANLATDDMRNPDNLNCVLKLAKGILNFLLSVCVSYMRIDNLQLPRADFAGSRLSHTNLSHSNFASSDFSFAYMGDGSARDCDFSSATLKDVDASKTDFTGALFSYADLSGGKFDGAILSKSKLDSVAFGKKNTSEINDIADKLGASPKTGAKSIESYDEQPSNWEKEDVSAVRLASLVKACIEKYHVVDKDEADPKRVAKDKEAKRYSLLSSYEGVYTSYETAAMAAINAGKKLSVQIKTYDEVRALAKQHNTKHSDSPIEEPSASISLIGATLDEALIPNVDFSIVDFSSASMRNADLFDVSMSYAVGVSANLSGANLYQIFAYRTDFRNANFASANFGEGRFVDCNFDSANFNESVFLGAVFLGTKGNAHKANRFISLLNQNWSGVKSLSLPEISEPKDVGTVDLDPGKAKYTFVNASFRSCNGTQAVFAGLSMSRCVLAKGIFRSALFFDCDASSTVWTDADLTFSMHFGVQYTRSAFKNASLQEIQAYACDFTCCNLIGAKLLGSTIEQCIFYDSNISNANLSHCVFSFCVFRDAVLEGSFISGTEFEECIFIGIDFGGITGLSRATFTKCRFINCTFNGEKCKTKSPSVLDEKTATSLYRHTLAIGSLTLQSEPMVSSIASNASFSSSRSEEDK